MDDVLNGVLDGASQDNNTQVVDDQQQADGAHQAADDVGDQGASTAQHSGTEKHVPLAALEAERKGRQDWKEKAARLEGELSAIREQQQRAAQPQGQQQQQDPVQVLEQQIFNQNLNFSERMARKEYGTEAVDQAFEKFNEAVKKNPALYQQVMSSPDPWDAVVKEAKKMALLEEVGTDPVAYREKLRAELLAEINPAGGAPAAPALPKSLAGARSSAVRSAPAFTGPTPIEDILNK